MIDALWQRWRQRYAPHTAYNRGNILKRLLRSLQPIGAPPLTVARMNHPQPRAVICTSEKIDAILKDTTPAMRLFVLLCWHTALRFSEALAVTPASFNAQDHTITIRTKGGKVRTIETPMAVYEMLQAAKACQPDTNESCVSILNGRPLSPEGIRTAWHRLTKKAGVPELRPHDLRRTTATNLYRATHDLRAVQQYLGHENMASTVSYIAPLAKEELAGLHRLLNFHSQVKQ